MKKYFIRTLLIAGMVLCGAFIAPAGTGTGPVRVEAKTAKKFKLKGSTTVTVNKKVTLKSNLKKKVKWTIPSKAKKYASFTKTKTSLTIKGKKKGSFTIKATSNGKTIKKTVKIQNASQKNTTSSKQVWPWTTADYNKLKSQAEKDHKTFTSLPDQLDKSIYSMRNTSDHWYYSYGCYLWDVKGCIGTGLLWFGNCHYSCWTPRDASTGENKSAELCNPGFFDSAYYLFRLYDVTDRAVISYTASKKLNLGYDRDMKWKDFGFKVTYEYGDTVPTYNSPEMKINDYFCLNYNHPKIALHVYDNQKRLVSYNYIAAPRKVFHDSYKKITILMSDEEWVKWQAENHPVCTDDYCYPAPYYSYETINNSRPDWKNASSTPGIDGSKPCLFAYEQSWQGYKDDDGIRWH